MKICVFIVLALTTTSRLLATDWEWVYPRPAPTQPHIIEIATDGSIWALTRYYDPSHQFLKSVDGGHTFDTISAIDGQLFGGIAPLSADVVIAWQRDGYNYKTSDGGKTWSRFMFENEPRVYHLSYSSDGHIWAGSDRCVLEYIQPDAEPIVHTIPVLDTTVYRVKVSEDFIVCLSPKTLWYRTRTNPEWHRYESMDGQDIFGFELAGSMIYVETADSLVAVDALRHTSRTITYDEYGTISTRDGKHLVSISESMCATSNDGGLSWTEQMIAPNHVFSHAWITDTSLIAFTYIGETLLSTDRGESWTPDSSRMPSFELFTMTTDGVMYGLSSELTRAHRSNDLGDSWTLIAMNPPSELPMLYVDWDAAFRLVSDSVWYLQHNAYFYRTINAGKDWDSVSGEWYKECFVSIGSDTLYAFERLTYPSSPKQYSTKVFRSTNAGANWSTVHSSDTHWQAASFLSKGLIILYEGGGSNNYMVSRDGGDTWLSEFIKSVERFGLSSDGSQWGTNSTGTQTKGVYITTDNGMTWQKTLSAGSCDIPIHVRDSTFLVNCNSGSNSSGLYQSDDMGLHWNKLNLPRGEWKLQRAPDGTVYAADSRTMFRFSVANATGVDDSDPDHDDSPRFAIDRVQIYSLTGSLFASVQADAFDDLVANKLPCGLWICVEQTASGSWVSKKIAVY